MASTIQGRFSTKIGRSNTVQSTNNFNDIYNNRRQVTSITVTPEDMKNFAIRVSNRANKKFDPITNILDQLL